MIVKRNYIVRDDSMAVYTLNDMMSDDNGLVEVMHR